MEPVPRLNAELSPEARQAWRDFRERHDITERNLLELLAWRLEELIPEDMVEEARRMGIERRRRD